MPVVVVSDSSPIRALHHLGLLSLCRSLYGSVIIPEAVRQELRRATGTCPALEIAGLPGLEVRAPRVDPVDVGVPSDLDAGETEAIALAIELRADLLLMDERKGTESRAPDIARAGIVRFLRLGPLPDSEAKPEAGAREGGLRAGQFVA